MVTTVRTATNTRTTDTEESVVTRPGTKKIGFDGKGGRGNGSRGPGGGGPGGPGGGGGHDDRSSRQQGGDRYRIGMWVGLASIVMMFTALSSAYIVRQGVRSPFAWRTAWMPSFAWLSTGLILASSVTIHAARNFARRGAEAQARRWLMITLALGLGFLVSQLLAWQQLVAAGFYLKSNPHSAFFYVLTGLHGVHLLGGILALGYLAFRAWSTTVGARVEARRRVLTDVVTIYWHFMDGLWVYLFLLLLLWR